MRENTLMIILKVKAICPICEEHIEIDFSQPDAIIEACREEILLSFKCSQCGEYIDKEAWETE
jgi:hypothetical protein